MKRFRSIKENDTDAQGFGFEQCQLTRTRIPCKVSRAILESGTKYCPTNLKHEMLTALASDRVSQI